MKKILALTLVLIMALSLATTAFAAEGDTYSITINNKLDGHTYEAYQIFTGDLAKNSANDDVDGTNAVLSNVVWGNGVTIPAEGIVIGKDADGNEIKSTDATAIAEALAKKTLKLEDLLAVLTLTENKATSTDKGDYYLIDNLQPGYYLIKDANDSLDGKYDAYTAYIIEVLEDSTVNPKSSIPEVDKQVWDEEDDAEEGNEDGWGETADHAMNETFQFKLIATLPADVNFAEYEKYQVVFKDQMSQGITFENVVSVKINGAEVQQYTLSDNAKAPLKGAAEWSLTIADIKTATGNAVDLTKGAVVEVIYNAHLNEEAKVGNDDSNKNTVYLEYSNNPNAGGENELGKTTEDTVWVFTYKVDSTKYADEIKDTNKLPGAGFTLYTTTDGTTKGNPVKLVFDATKKVYRPASAAEIAADATAEVKTVVTEMTSAADGKFNVIGLDVGTYIMEETNVPAGYNKCADITIEITAVHEETDKDNAETEITMKKDNVAASQVDVVNKSGTILPEAGGMGTTIFYIVGGLLAVAAVVLLITKKRMSSAE